MPSRIGNYTLKLEKAPYISGYGSCAGEKEAAGPIGKEFDLTFDDPYLGQPTWEKAESEMLRIAIQYALDKSGLESSDINYLFAGDLLNQCTGSTFGAIDFNIPHIGLFGACSTMALSLGLAACFTDAGLAKNALAATSSHFCTAERQFRYPLEYGGQRTPTAQWTATAAGAMTVSAEKTGISKVRINDVTFGRITDKDVKDPNNMGAAMAPAACDTICNFLRDTGTAPDDYDVIITGDLGRVGSNLLYELLAADGYDITENHADCGLLIFSPQTQDVHSGGSGCGCSASVLCSRIMHNMEMQKLKNVLFCATGALMSPTSQQQKNSIPGIAHLIHMTTI